MFASTCAMSQTRAGTGGMMSVPVGVMDEAGFVRQMKSTEVA